MGTEVNTLLAIRQRYEDTSLLIFHQQQKKIGFSVAKKQYTVNMAENVATALTTSKGISKYDEKSIKSSLCIII